jgi:hypothetical protein
MEGLLDELVRALIREGGQATLDRLLHVSSRLRQAGRDRVLEAARMSGEIEVLEEELYAYHPDPHRYIVLRLARAREPAELDGQTALEGVQAGGKTPREASGRRLWPWEGE